MTESVPHLRSLAVTAALGAIIMVSTAAPADAVTRCRITDPTDTALNVREWPNGPVINRLRNGRLVVLQEIDHDDQGRQWARVAGEYEGEWREWGWVFREFISCF